MAKIRVKMVEIDELLEALRDMRAGHIMIDLELDDKDQVVIIHPVEQSKLTDDVIRQLSK